MYINGVLNSYVFSLDTNLLTTSYSYTSAAATYPKNTTFSFVVHDTRDTASNSATASTTDFYLFEYWCKDSFFGSPPEFYVSLADGTSIPGTVNEFGTGIIKTISYSIKSSFCNGLWDTLAVGLFD